MKRARSRELEGKIRHWSTPPNNGERVNISRGSPINPSSRRLGTYHRVEIRFSFMHESLATPDPVNLDPLIAKLIATRTEGLPYRFDVKKRIPSIRRLVFLFFFERDSLHESCAIFYSVLDCLAKGNIGRSLFCSSSRPNDHSKSLFVRDSIQFLL